MQNHSWSEKETDCGVPVPNTTYHKPYSQNSGNITEEGIERSLEPETGITLLKNTLINAFF